MSIIVVSGVNLKEGGILSVLEDCLHSLKTINKLHEHKIIVLVHSLNLVEKYLDFFDIREYPEIKESWRRRLSFEFTESKKISEQIKPDIWIALHDVTPNVSCKYQVVYCHNPSPFYKLPVSDYLYDIKFTLFNAFYKYLYAINVKKNKYVIVQQNWLRAEFYRRYKVETIVAYPQVNDVLPASIGAEKGSDVYTFFYPSFPRVFKNFEVLLAAADELLKSRKDFKLIITIKGDENKYSQKLYNRYSGNPNVEFTGLLPRKKVFELYKQCDCLLFPSKLETWGLPLSEIKSFKKPIIASDLQYAHESVGAYEKVKFFDPNDYKQLANYMNQAINNNLEYDTNTIERPQFPFFENWDELLAFLIADAATL